MSTIFYGNHRIDIPGMTLTGKEDIRYDGKVVSSKHSMTGATHVFSVREDNEDVQYEVELGTRWHGLSTYAIVRRNAKIIFSNK